MNLRKLIFYCNCVEAFHYSGKAGLVLRCVYLSVVVEQFWKSSLADFRLILGASSRRRYDDGAGLSCEGSHARAFKWK